MGVVEGVPILGIAMIVLILGILAVIVSRCTQQYYYIESNIYENQQSAEKQTGRGVNG